MRQLQAFGVRPPRVRDIVRDISVLVVAAVMVAAVLLALAAG